MILQQNVVSYCDDTIFHYGRSSAVLMVSFFSHFFFCNMMSIEDPILELVTILWFIEQNSNNFFYFSSISTLLIFSEN